MSKPENNLVVFPVSGPKPAGNYSFDAFVVEWLQRNGSSLTLVEVMKNSTLVAHIRRQYVEMESLRLMQIGQGPARFEFVSSEPIVPMVVAPPPVRPMSESVAVDPSEDEAEQTLPIQEFSAPPVEPAVAEVVPAPIKPAPLAPKPLAKIIAPSPAPKPPKASKPAAIFTQEHAKTKFERVLVGIWAYHMPQLMLLCLRWLCFEALRLEQKRWGFDKTNHTSRKSAELVEFERDLKPVLNQTAQALCLYFGFDEDTLRGAHVDEPEIWDELKHIVIDDVFHKDLFHRVDWDDVPARRSSSFVPMPAYIRGPEIKVAKTTKTTVAPPSIPREPRINLANRAGKEVAVLITKAFDGDFQAIQAFLRRSDITNEGSLELWAGNQARKAEVGSIPESEYTVGLERSCAIEVIQHFLVRLARQTDLTDVQHQGINRLRERVLQISTTDFMQLVAVPVVVHTPKPLVPDMKVPVKPKSDNKKGKGKGKNQPKKK